MCFIILRILFCDNYLYSTLCFECHRVLTRDIFLSLKTDLKCHHHHPWSNSARFPRNVNSPFKHSQRKLELSG